MNPPKSSWRHDCPTFFDALHHSMQVEKLRWYPNKKIRISNVLKKQTKRLNLNCQGILYS